MSTVQFLVSICGLPLFCFLCKMKTYQGVPMTDLHRLIKKKELVDLTIRLVQIPTENPPGNEKTAVPFLKPILSKMGFKVKTLLSPKGRWNIIAERRWGKGGRTLIFNGHLDVVPAGDPSQWKYPPFQGKLAQGKDLWPWGIGYEEWDCFFHSCPLHD